METRAEKDDERPMREALAEARLGEGGTRPNPPVGAVLVSRDGETVARRHSISACVEHGPEPGKTAETGGNAAPQQRRVVRKHRPG
ncbi:MAG: hypothetical protein IJ783_00350, partial [Kiritimatiellae bacterium]|nr:hypothetical protein [Kiritimatiellia bacterium]